MIVEYENVIVKTTCRVLTPFIQIYALYVIIHGHYSPGGGFQGGVILGASFILLMIAYGYGSEEIRKRVSLKTFKVLASLGLLLYAGIGVVALLGGGNYLDYGKLPLPMDSLPALRAMGILGIEIGVGVSVMAIMIIIFWALAFYEGGETRG